MAVTNDVLAAFRAQIAAQMPSTFEILDVSEGGALDMFLATRKGLQCFVSYRSETPVKRDASAAHILRGMVIAVTVFKTIGGRSRRDSQVANLNDVMDQMLDVIVEPQQNSKWWGADVNILGLGPNGINSISSPNSDFAGRDMLFNVMVG
jgi:hypothetical protein